MRGWQESLADFLKSALAYLSLSELILLLPEQALEHVRLFTPLVTRTTCVKLSLNPDWKRTFCPDIGGHCLS
jgi:hypothetical protein